MGQALIPELALHEPSMCAVTLDTASRKLLANENVKGMYLYQVFYDEEGTTITGGMTLYNHVLW